MKSSDFKEGGWVVLVDNRSSSKNKVGDVGQMSGHRPDPHGYCVVAVPPNTPDPSSCCSWYTDLRLAEPHEIPRMMIAPFKEGDWVVVLDTPHIKSWSGHARRAIGFVFKVDKNQQEWWDKDPNDGCAASDNRHCINYKASDLRMARPEEIPGYVAEKKERGYIPKEGDKVNIPTTKRGVTTGADIEAFRKQIKPEWKWLTVKSTVEPLNTGVRGPNNEGIETNSFHHSDLSLYMGEEEIFPGVRIGDIRVITQKGYENHIGKVIKRSTTTHSYMILEYKDRAESFTPEQTRPATIEEIELYESGVRKLVDVKASSIDNQGITPGNFKEIVKKHGFINGVKFKQMDTGMERTIEREHEIYFNPETGKIHSCTPSSEWGMNKEVSNPPIYDNGKWAEIVIPVFNKQQKPENMTDYKSWTGKKVRLIRQPVSSDWGYCYPADTSAILNSKVTQYVEKGDGRHLLQMDGGAFYPAVCFALDESTFEGSGLVNASSWGYRIGERVVCKESGGSTMGGNKLKSTRDMMRTGEKGTITGVDKMYTEVKMDSDGKFVIRNEGSAYQYIKKEGESMPSTPKFQKGDIVTIIGTESGSCNMIEDIGCIYEAHSGNCHVDVNDRSGAGNLTVYRDIRMATMEEAEAYSEGYRTLSDYKSKTNRRMQPVVTQGSTGIAGYSKSGESWYDAPRPYTEAIDVDAVTMSNIHMGMKVVRGKDWKWNDQDRGSVYGVINRLPTEGNKWASIQWIRADGSRMGTSHSYRVGQEENKRPYYDLFMYHGKDVVMTTNILEAAPLISFSDDIKIDSYRKEEYGLIRID